MSKRILFPSFQILHWSPAGGITSQALEAAAHTWTHTRDEWNPAGELPVHVERKVGRLVQHGQQLRDLVLRLFLHGKHTIRKDRLQHMSVA